MRTGRSPWSMRLTDKGKNLLEQLAELRGISQTSVIEQLVRDEAERKGLVSALAPSPKQEAGATE